jgi:hypothetical protein
MIDDFHAEALGQRCFGNRSRRSGRWNSGLDAGHNFIRQEYSPRDRRRLAGAAGVSWRRGTYILGVLLQFFIVCSAAAIYCAVSRKLRS